jgi:hypothetical protein
MINFFKYHLIHKNFTHTVHACDYVKVLVPFPKALHTVRNACDYVEELTKAFSQGFTHGSSL